MLTSEISILEEIVSDVSDEDEGPRLGLTPKGAPLAQDAQEHLLRRVESMQHAASTRPPEREPVLARTKTTDFSTLPGYDELRLYRLDRSEVRARQPVFPHPRRHAPDHTRRSPGNRCSISPRTTISD